MTLIKELPEFERPREKMRFMGAKRLSNSELLAILLGSGTRNMSATALADSILSMDKGGLAYLAECLPEELAALRGMGMAKSCKIAAAVELGKRIATAPRRKKVDIGRPDDISALFMEEMRYLKNECFRILLLNIKNEIISIEEVTEGNINTSVIDPREVFRPAIKKGAAYILMVHNHPSGNPTPSTADVDVTLRLCESGELLGIRVLDHIVIGNGVYVSMRREDLI
ncbi:MAG: DNA repair protein RadC [Clostridiales Family XIII bacterium]|jgi:DNA repair protein RadC|nr:DNA repair protein RadC [Clostridiales Family XIII bacterium]